MTKAEQNNKVQTLSPIALNDLILRSIVDHAIVAMDADGIITRWNEGAERILGWTEEEAIGQHGSIFFTPADVENARPETEMRLALENGRAEDERWHVRKNGQRFWGSGLMMPLLAGTDGAGDAVQSAYAVEGFVKVFRDATNDSARSEGLSPLENRAALAVRRSQAVGVYDYDVLEGIVVADPANADMHSVAQAEATEGTSVERFYAGVDAADQLAVRGAVDSAIDNGGDIDITYRVFSSGPSPRWVQSQGSVHRDGDGRVARLSGIVTEVTRERERARMQDARLQFSNEVRDLDDAVEIAQRASRVIGETLYVNRAGLGYLQADGDSLDIVTEWATDGLASLVGIQRYSDFGEFGAVLHANQAVVIKDARADDRVHDSTALEGIGVLSLINLPLMERGHLKAILYVGCESPREWNEDEIAFLQAMFDRTDAALSHARARTERDVMVAELAHRMKNMLTIAQVVVTQSLQGISGDDGIAQARMAIAARLNALSKAQDILTSAHQQDADIVDVVKTALAPHDPRGRITVDGPSLSLDSQHVLGLSLALHELATNAAKYGSLSGETGRVTLTWLHGADGTFELRWAEHDGPAVVEPSGRGFGTKILAGVAGSYFNGTSKVEYHPDGVRFVINGNVPT